MISLTIDTETREILVESIPARLKRGDGEPVEVTFSTDGAAVSLEEDAVVKIGIKRLGKYSGLFLASATLAAPEEEGEPYTATLDLNTERLVSAMTDGEADLAELDVMLEVTWIPEEDAAPRSAPTLFVTIDNDVIKDGEETPITAAPWLQVESDEADVTTGDFFVNITTTIAPRVFLPGPIRKLVVDDDDPPLIGCFRKISASVWQVRFTAAAPADAKLPYLAIP